MLNHWIVKEMAYERRDNFIKEAETHRLAREVKKERGSEEGSMNPHLLNETKTGGVRWIHHLYTN
jgi:hypothetical protein